jgi:hypothetical protein
MSMPNSIAQPQWTDDELASAIRDSVNWRSVMVLLGFGERSTSAGAVRIVRRRAAELNLDWSHFRGKRRWSDAQLEQAAADCRSWTELLAKLGLSAKSGNVLHVKSHAARLGLDTSHLRQLSHTGRQPAEPPTETAELQAQLKFLRVAAGTLAATWFMLRGCAVSFPAEPTVYDLLADTPQGIKRVQVKTTTSFQKYGWQASVGHRRIPTRRRRALCSRTLPMRSTCSSSSTET